MVKYRIYYEDGSYDLIKCPECSSKDTSLNEGEDLIGMICTACETRFHIGEQGKKIIKIVSDDEAERENVIISENMVRDIKEFEDRAKRLRKEVRE